MSEHIDRPRNRQWLIVSSELISHPTSYSLNSFGQIVPSVSWQVLRPSLFGLPVECSRPGAGCKLVTGVDDHSPPSDRGSGFVEFVTNHCNIALHGPPGGSARRHLAVALAVTGYTRLADDLCRRVLLLASCARCIEELSVGAD